MFIRTTNLLLRPAWREDAPRLAVAFGQPAVVMTLANAPWPYSIDDAVSYIDHSGATGLPELLIVSPRDGTKLIGGVGLVQREAGIELGYWIEPAYWGRGYATEAGHGLVAAARDTLRLDSLISAHFVDNPASGRILEKLGFAPTGVVAPRPCRARACDVDAIEYALDLRIARADA